MSVMPSRMGFTGIEGDAMAGAAALPCEIEEV